MGRPPAVVFIARHGARLDAADKQWHLTSPTPYDPPLTYGGWVQSRTLGNRIGNILHNRYSLSEGASGTSDKNNGVQALDRARDGNNGHSNGESIGSRKKKRKYKVIIHVSPFLRCIQTSIAISAGIAHHEGLLRTDDHFVPAKHHTLHSEAQHPTHSASPHLTGAENSKTAHLSSIPEPEISIDNATENKKHAEDQFKPCMRLDAFLGEWLSPDYFDLITPPPNSVMMLTSAKADLIRVGEYVDVPAGSYRNTQDKGNFPGGWGSSSQAASDTSSQHGGGPLSSLATIGASLPRVQRASSHKDVNGVPGPRSVSKIETSVSQSAAGYEPPTPSYAISPSDPIPPGYVAHARDACVDVDFRWDSMRQPHDWGHGGEYGEEWSAMHKRFRRGLHSMIAWYSNNPPGLSTQTIIEGSDKEVEMDETDVDTDIVLILVTHGAGCNALIGALTNQPVLLDVGMASLTMAVRKETAQPRPRNPVASMQSVKRQSLVESDISDEYDVKITASTEHLQSRSRTSTTSLSYRSPSIVSSPLSTHRYRTNSAASTTSSSSFTDGDFRLDPEARAMTGSGEGGGLARSSSLSGGLWSKPVSEMVDGATDRPLKEKAPQLSGHSPLVKEASGGGMSSSGEKPHGGKTVRDENVHGAPGHAITQYGLWGAPPATTASEREKGLKRRWTHSEQR
ncbi:MAG: hypothetical protein Q9188_005015 [Gyalolechia gomerana]